MDATLVKVTIFVLASVTVLDLLVSKRFVGMIIDKLTNYWVFIESMNERSDAVREIMRLRRYVNSYRLKFVFMYVIAIFAMSIFAFGEILYRGETSSRDTVIAVTKKISDMEIEYYKYLTEGGDAKGKQQVSNSCRAVMLRSACGYINNKGKIDSYTSSYQSIDWHLSGYGEYKYSILLATSYITSVVLISIVVGFSLYLSLFITNYVLTIIRVIFDNLYLIVIFDFAAVFIMPLTLVYSALMITSAIKIAVFGDIQAWYLSITIPYGWIFYYIQMTVYFLESVVSVFDNILLRIVEFNGFGDTFELLGLLFYYYGIYILGNFWNSIKMVPDGSVINVEALTGVYNWGLFFDILFSFFYVAPSIFIFIVYKYPRARIFVSTIIESIASHQKGPVAALALLLGAVSIALEKLLK